MSKLTVKDVMSNMRWYMRDCTSNKHPYVCDVSEEFSIFDWWKDKLSRSDMKQMYKFLELATKLGYTGHTCFKVGTKGYSSGMWAYISDNSSDFIWRSFSPDYTEYSCRIDGKLYDFKTQKELKDFLKTLA